MRSQSHRQQILERLKEAGSIGVHSFDLNRNITWKSCTRISELRKDGWKINKRREKRGDAYGVRYVLERE